MMLYVFDLDVQLDARLRTPPRALLTVLPVDTGGMPA
jgi:hypothetical protein